MAEWTSLVSELETAKKLVDFLEDDGVPLSCAIFAVDGEGKGRLYLVPRTMNGSRHDKMVDVARTLAKHDDDLPDGQDLRFSVVDRENPVVKAVLSRGKSSGKVNGVYGGTNVDVAYIFRAA